MSDSPTVTGSVLPWGEGRRQAPRLEWHLTIVWSLEEPWRVGESAAIRGETIVGRGDASSSDGAPRAVFHARRPGSAEPRPALASERVSRKQLRLRPSDEEKLAVESIGRATLLVDGAETTVASVSDGAILELKNGLVLYVTRRAALEPLAHHPKPSFPFGEADRFGMVGESHAMWRLRDELALAAEGPHHVLLLGESGVGKELAARSVHGLSRRANGPWIARNAATFPEGLVDAEVFGSAKNYPHAGSPERPGLVGEAEGGVLFLDEIGELPSSLQAHLLRFLDSGGEYQRLGEGKVRKADVRVVAATHRAVDALKHDFGARFASRVRVPGLADRREDIPFLVRHRLFRLADEVPSLKGRFFFARPDGRLEPRIDPRLLIALVRHRYTLHSRELERLLWTAVSTTRETFIELTSEVESELDLDPAHESSEDIGQESIASALEEARGNVTLAAKKLGLKNRYALYRLMKRLAIPLPKESS